MKHLATVLILLTTACSGGAEDAPGMLAVQTSDGNIHLVDPVSGEETPVTTDAGISTLYTQPTWSPDGTQLAFVEASTTEAPGQFAAGGVVRVADEAQAINSSIHIVTVDERTRDVEIATPFGGFYLYWSPDGAFLAFLGNDADGVGLGVVDVARGSAARIDKGQPYYFAWSPDSDRLLAHAGNDLYFVDPGGKTEPLTVTPGTFVAPGWVGDSVLYSVVGDDGNDLVLADRSFDIKRLIHSYPSGIAAQLSPDGETVAYIDIAAGSTTLSLGALVVDTDDGLVEVAPNVTAFFWNADGSRLLYLAPDDAGEALSFRWGVWDGQATIEFDSFVPSSTLFVRYLPFFGQYSNSHSFFSPDGFSFVYAGTVNGDSGIWIQESAPGAVARKLTDGVLATWAP